jgi:hypothetical protein
MTNKPEITYKGTLNGYPQVEVSSIQEAVANEELLSSPLPKE